MKRNISFLIMAIIAAGIFSGCEELPPFIDFTPEVIDTSLTDTTYVESPAQAPQEKNVLIEDFTGVRCPNCPAAQVKATAISDENPGRVVIVGLHPTGVGVLTTPYDESQYDFRLQAAGDIFILLEGTSGPGLPVGAIDRFQFPGESLTVVNDDKWKNYTEQRLKQANPVNLYLETEYDEAANEVVITTELHYTRDLAEEHYISIWILESHIVDVQKNENQIIPNYEHNHVLRQLITVPAGKKLTAPLEEGRVIIKQYRVKLKEEYVVDNLDVVAFVHKSGSSNEVLQVQEKPVKE